MERSFRVLPRILLCYVTPLPQECMEVMPLLRNTLVPKVSLGYALCKSLAGKTLSQMDQLSFLNGQQKTYQEYKKKGDRFHL